MCFLNLEQQKSDYLTERRFEELSKSLVSENDKLKSQLSSVLKELNNLKCVNDEHELLLKQTSISIQNYEKRINELQNLTTELMTVKVSVLFYKSAFLSLLLTKSCFSFINRFKLNMKIAI